MLKKPGDANLQAFLLVHPAWAIAASVASVSCALPGMAMPTSPMMLPTMMVCASPLELPNLDTYGLLTGLFEA